MPSTLLTTITPKVNDGVIGRTSGTLLASEFSAQAIDATNGNSFVYSNLTGLFIHNTSTSNALTVTIDSQLDTNGRDKTITAVIPSSGYAVVNFLDHGFNSSGKVEVTFAGTSPQGNIIPVQFTRP